MHFFFIGNIFSYREPENYLNNGIFILNKFFWILENRFPFHSKYNLISRDEKTSEQPNSLLIYSFKKRKSDYENEVSLDDWELT